MESHPTYDYLTIEDYFGFMKAKIDRPDLSLDDYVTEVHVAKESKGKERKNREEASKPFSHHDIKKQPITDPELSEKEAKEVSMARALRHLRHAKLGAWATPVLEEFSKSLDDQSNLAIYLLKEAQTLYLEGAAEIIPIFEAFFDKIKKAKVHNSTPVEILKTNYDNIFIRFLKDIDKVISSLKPEEYSSISKGEVKKQSDTTAPHAVGLDSARLAHRQAKLKIIGPILDALSEYVDDTDVGDYIDEFKSKYIEGAPSLILIMDELQYKVRALGSGISAQNLIREHFDDIFEPIMGEIISAISSLNLEEDSLSEDEEQQTTPSTQVKSSAVKTTKDEFDAICIFNYLPGFYISNLEKFPSDEQLRHIALPFGVNADLILGEFRVFLDTLINILVQRMVIPPFKKAELELVAIAITNLSNKSAVLARLYIDNDMILRHVKIWRVTLESFRAAINQQPNPYDVPKLLISSIIEKAEEFHSKITLSCSNDSQKDYPTIVLLLSSASDLTPEQLEQLYKILASNFGRNSAETLMSDLGSIREYWADIILKTGMTLNLLTGEILKIGLTLNEMKDLVKIIISNAKLNFNMIKKESIELKTQLIASSFKNKLACFTYLVENSPTVTDALQAGMERFDPMEDIKLIDLLSGEEFVGFMILHVLPHVYSYNPNTFPTNEQLRTIITPFGKDSEYILSEYRKLVDGLSALVIQHSSEAMPITTTLNFEDVVSSLTASLEQLYIASEQEVTEHSEDMAYADYSTSLSQRSNGNIGASRDDADNEWELSSDDGVEDVGSGLAKAKLGSL